MWEMIGEGGCRSVWRRRVDNGVGGVCYSFGCKW